MKLSMYVFFLLFVTYGFNQTADDLYNSGYEKIELEDYSGAIADFSLFLSKYPDDLDVLKVYNHRAYCKQQMKDNFGAISDCDLVLKKDSKNITALINRSYSRYSLGDYNNAIADCNLILKLDPSETIGYINRGLCKIMLKQKTSGCSDFSKAGELGNSHAYKLIGRYCQ